MSTRTPTLAAILNAVKAQTFADLRVSMPARVEKYDDATQLADVQPLLKESYVDEEGERAIARLPVITNVPVVFPGGGGMRITFPVRAGDTVMLVFSDRSIDSWLAQGGEATPEDERRHHLSDAVAWPGLHPNTAPWNGAEENVVTLGDDTSASDFVALATATRAEITELRNTVDALVTKFNTHGHNTIAAVSGVTATGSTTTPFLFGVPAVPPASFTTTMSADAPDAVGEIKSNTVKIKG